MSTGYNGIGCADIYMVFWQDFTSAIVIHYIYHFICDRSNVASDSPGGQSLLFGMLHGA